MPTREKNMETISHVVDSVVYWDRDPDVAKKQKLDILLLLAVNAAYSLKAYKVSNSLGLVHDALFGGPRPHDEELKEAFDDLLAELKRL